MKVNFVRYLILFIFIFISLIFYLSFIGIETDKFNQQIKDKIIKFNVNLDLDIKKVKLTLDPLKLKIHARTIGPVIYFSNKPIKLEHIKLKISLLSIIKKNIVSSNLEIGTRSVLAKDLVEFIREINNDPRLLILQKIIKNGYLILNLKFYFDENGNIQNNYEFNGSLKDGNIKSLDGNIFKNINLKFNAKKNNINFQQLNF